MLVLVVIIEGILGLFVLRSPTKLCFHSEAVQSHRLLLEILFVLDFLCDSFISIVDIDILVILHMIFLLGGSEVPAILREFLPMPI